jgi:hypothetical protein
VPWLPELASEEIVKQIFQASSSLVNQQKKAQHVINLPGWSHYFTGIITTIHLSHQPVQNKTKDDNIGN